MNEIIGLVILIGFLFFFFYFLGKIDKTKKRATYEASKADYYANQQIRVEVGGYKKQALLNQTEKIAYKAILDAREEHKLRVFAQVSLGEILSHNNKQLYLDINSKRVDFLLTDSRFMPLLVIEIHGSGHYSGSSSERRDEIKRIALQDAGIAYLAIATGGDQIYQDVFSSCKQWILNHIKNS